jgi:hypothetical protein
VCCKVDDRNSIAKVPFVPQHNLRVNLLPTISNLVSLPQQLQLHSSQTARDPKTIPNRSLRSREHSSLAINNEIK